VTTATIWTEDECTRGLAGHEYLHDAWQRIFGQAYDSKLALKENDHGDASESVFNINGRTISAWDIHGAWCEIREHK
jgi:hypothetical protein